MLECVSQSFMTSLYDIKAYSIIKKMGTIDAVTGLKNRNSYEQNLHLYANVQDENLCCIYIDVNGLHDLNNTLGHAMGDEMLHVIAKELASHFGNEHTYRIGGDEFVAFSKDDSLEKVQEKVTKMKESLKQNDYYISVGIACINTSYSLKNMISDAEKRMYEAKRNYYKAKGDETKARKMNTKLEEILMQKKDVDDFITTISKFFLGAFAADLVNDTFRIVYEPPYYKDIKWEKNNLYSSVLDNYSYQLVEKRDGERFRTFINYDKIIEQLDKGELPEIHYHRFDGVVLILRVYKAPTYSKINKDTFWLIVEENLEADD